MDQLSLFDMLDEPEPGQWVTAIGPEISFDDICNRVGQIIILDKSTESHKWYKAVRVERIIWNDDSNCRRLIYYDGARQRGLVNEYYFEWGGQKAYALP